MGVKGNPQGFNRGLDCDVIVAEVNDRLLSCLLNLPWYDWCSPENRFLPSLHFTRFYPRSAPPVTNRTRSTAWSRDCRPAPGRSSFSADRTTSSPTGNTSSWFHSKIILHTCLFNLFFFPPFFFFFTCRVTLGNQLDGIHLLDPEVVARFKKRYPDGVISKPKNMQWWLQWSKRCGEICV